MEHEGTLEKGLVPDWIILGLGVVLAALSFGLEQIPTAFGAILGAAIVAAALWDMQRPQMIALLVIAVLTVATLALPFFGGFAFSGAAWGVWLLGIALGVCAAWSWAAHPTT